MSYFKATNPEIDYFSKPNFIAADLRKYMISAFDFDRMIEYGTEPVDQKRTIPNPQYKQLTYQIKKAREKKARLEARIFQQMEGNGETKGVDHLAQTILKSANLIEKINGYNDEIKVLLAKRED